MMLMVETATQEIGRPVIDHSRTGVDWLLEIAAIMGLVGAFAILGSAWSQLPERIPLHFDITGKPDGWGNKGWLWILPMIGAVIYVGFTALVRVPHRFNYPWKITPENAQRQYRIARSLLTWLKAQITLLLAAIAWTTIRVALGKAEGIGAWFVPVLVGVLLATVVVHGAFALRAR
jgi:uncharacterized membrane protein